MGVDELIYECVVTISQFILLSKNMSSSDSAVAPTPTDVLVNILDSLVGTRVMYELVDEEDHVERDGFMDEVNAELKRLIKLLRMENAEQRDRKKRRMLDYDDDSEEEEDSEESGSDSSESEEEEEEEDSEEDEECVV